MVAVVQAGSFMPTGESITVSGSTKPITRANEAVVVAGLSDANGRFSVTVNSTTAAALQSYKVSFYIADGGNLGKFVVDAAPLTGTYASAVATTATPTPTIAASSEVTVKVAITDQFGQPVSTRGTSALNVELKAPDKTKLEQFNAVVAGEASFTFTNYLKTGESDVLTARVYVGTSTSPTYTGLQTQVNMYAPVAVTGINVAPEVTGVNVNYVDFITGKTTTAKPGPSAGSTPYSGTVVNANGAGIPGAAITIAGTGFQFKSGTSFTVDSVTLTTDSAGGFSVDMWTTVASAAGNKLTVTAGDKTASTLIKSVLPATTSTKNLVFGWDLPAVILSNTTYAITAKVTDKFGNGVPSASVTFSGFGAAQFNGLATATRTTDRSGNVTAFLRSLKDVDGVSAIGVELLVTGFTFTVNEGLAAVYTDVTTTSFDESKWTSVIENTIDFLKTAPAASSDKKVNAGSFKGYVALYAKGYEGQRMSAKVGNDWVIVPTIPAATNDLFRAVEFVGAGVEISVRLYIDRVLVATIPLLTK
jgi:flagellin-like hook-associated protein FlgL